MTERISDADGDWRCICGNTPNSSGFFPCLLNGRFIEPNKFGGWDGIHNRCADCGRIIDQNTLEVKRGPVSELEPCLVCGSADGHDEGCMIDNVIDGAS